MGRSDDRDRMAWQHGGEGRDDLGREAARGYDALGVGARQGTRPSGRNPMSLVYGERRGSPAAIGYQGQGFGHAGRGPRNYRRPDERIQEDVNDLLTADPSLDASGIAVSVSGGEVTLAGTVPSRRCRHRAEDLADSVPGVTHVQNNLRALDRMGPGLGTL